MNKKQALERAYKWAIGTPLRSMSATHAKRLAKEVKKLRDLGSELVGALDGIIDSVCEENCGEFDQCPDLANDPKRCDMFPEKSLIAKAKGVLDVE